MNIAAVKKVSKREAARNFGTLCDLVHNGETVVIVQSGKPYLKMIPALPTSNGKSVADFKARLDRISRKPIPGVAEVLKRVRG